jgi:hypothetical protein
VPPCHARVVADNGIIAQAHARPLTWGSILRAAGSLLGQVVPLAWNHLVYPLVPPGNLGQTPPKAITARMPPKAISAGCRRLAVAAQGRLGRSQRPGPKRDQMVASNQRAWLQAGAEGWAGSRPYVGWMMTAFVGTARLPGGEAR